MLIVALTHTLRRNCRVCWLLRWNRASVGLGTSLVEISRMFVLIQSEGGELLNTEQKRTNAFLTEYDPTNTAMFWLFLAAHAADSYCATDFSWTASSRLIWIFMNVVSCPHSIIRETAWQGTPNPFAFAHVCLGALHFNQLQSVFYRGRLPPVLPVLWRKMRGKKKNKKKNQKQYGLQVASSKKKNNQYRKKMNGVFKVRKPKWNHLNLWGGNTCWHGAPSLRSMSQTSGQQ